MLRDSEKIAKIHAILEKSSPEQRRQSLIHNMKSEITKGNHCFNCVGHCCTFVHNSMQVTPIEALDAFILLSSMDRINESLLEELDECIRYYRLDYEVALTGGRVMRRYYTCPFYRPGEKGCTLSLENKPYGCLAFNPNKNNVSTEGHCSSDISILETRENDSGNESTLNKEISDLLGLSWSKKSLPLALKEIIKVSYSF